MAWPCESPEAGVRDTRGMCHDCEYITHGRLGSARPVPLTERSPSTPPAGQTAWLQPQGSEGLGKRYL